MYIDQIRILPGAGKGARVLLFTGGAGSWKRRLVAGDAEVEPEDGPCSVRGFMGPDILSARDRGTGRARTRPWRALWRGGAAVRDLGLRGDELAPLLLGSWSCRRQVEGSRAMREVPAPGFSAAHLHAQTTGDQKQNQIKHAKLTYQEIENNR